MKRAGDAGEPLRVAGWPAEVQRFDLPGGALELLAVRDLESFLDRDALLADAETEPPYWALVWSGSRLLAAWFDERRDLTGRSFLDAGCGLGLVALAAARRGARVTAIDRDPNAVAFARASASRLGLDVECVQGDVGALAGSRTFDWIAAAELLYDRDDFARLARSFAGALAPDGGLVVADARRVRTDGFYAELESLGLRGRGEGETSVEEDGTRVRIRLATWAAARRGAAEGGVP